MMNGPPSDDTEVMNLEDITEDGNHDGEARSILIVECFCPDDARGLVDNTSLTVTFAMNFKISRGAFEKQKPTSVTMS